MEKEEIKGYLEPNTKEFIANGTKYYIAKNTLTINRFVYYQILEKEAGFGISFEDLYKAIDENIEYIKNISSQDIKVNHLLDILVKLTNIKNGIQILDKKEPPILKLCTLFINTKDEDTSIWSDELCTKKINDWKIEGIDINFFFGLALNSINGFLTIYKSMHQKLSS